MVEHEVLMGLSKETRAEEEMQLIQKMPPETERARNTRASPFLQLSCLLQGSPTGQTQLKASDMKAWETI